MFGKSGKPGDKNALTSRVRQLADKQTAAPTFAEPVQPPPRTPLRPEQKRAERVPQYKQAVLVIDGHEKLGVIIKDINTSGARVDFFQRRSLPDFVTLQEATMRLNRRARVMWQDGSSAGLKFE